MILRKAALFAILLALWPLITPGQVYQIETHVIGGGGGTSSGSDYVISGTLGQPLAGTASGGEYELSGGFWNVALEVVVKPDGTFEAWIENLPEEQKPPEGRRGPADDPAGDGMSNLLKYALGLMPMTPSAEAAPALAMQEGRLALELERSREAAVIFELEGSTDLTEWAYISFAEEILNPDLPGNRERLRLVTDLAPGEDSRHFLRLRVRME